MRWEFIVEDQDEGKRLDLFLVEKGFAPSRAYIQKLIKDGGIKVSGVPGKASMKVSSGLIIEVFIPQPQDGEPQPEPIPLDIIYEDGDIIVINKARGMVVHPAHGNPSATLVNALLWHCKSLSSLGGELRPGIVHRLDKGTSGIMVAAKNDMAYLSLTGQLKERTVLRRYIALVRGNPKVDEGIIDAPISRHPTRRKKMAVVDGGREAITGFQVRERFNAYSLIWATLETGRTHQIRVHMAYIGHPVAGDPVYGGRIGELGLKGQALHAQELRFRHPRTGELVEFQAPMPQDMILAMEKARRMTK